ncbi:probable galactinol--sucrose galactosyltransferase 1 [Asparagus officinalis]|uniref:probable galactinol--sucrose galactosyltransferase 1 n=1 Tax=Asparagus officinalis TaxID=4686 RepID=UPI00098DF11F|nr:probable galactinol--sucrose galactosyltransferase 1 [Asparagus officinalis]
MGASKQENRTAGFGLENGGSPPKFVIIDDGWQSVSMDSTGVTNEADNATNRARKYLDYGVKLPTREVIFLPKDAVLPITLKSREHEVFTVVPVKELSNGTSFAPIGLIKMFNSGGAIKEVKYQSKKAATIDVKVRGVGTFGAHSSARPKRIRVEEEDVEFGYEDGCGMVTFDLGIPQGSLHQRNISIEV